VSFFHNGYMVHQKYRKVNGLMLLAAQVDIHRVPEQKIISDFLPYFRCRFAFPKEDKIKEIIGQLLGLQSTCIYIWGHHEVSWVKSGI